LGNPGCGKSKAFYLFELVRISSGADVLAVRKIAKRYKNVVTVLPDRGEMYLMHMV